MSFKFINPGYANLMSHAIQHPNPNSQITKTGVCWYCFGSESMQNSAQFNLDSSYNVPAEFWLKFDCYIPDTNADVAFDFKFPHSAFDANFFIMPDHEGKYTASVYAACGGEETQLGSYSEAYTLDELKQITGLKLGGINTFWLHCQFSINSGSIELKLNDKTISASGTFYNNQFDGSIFFSIINNVNYSYKQYGLDDKAVFSNIIFSDEVIDINEKIIPLPVSATNSTMSTLSGGLYVADKVGQKILQSVDVAAVADIYGADSPLTGFFLAGYPAFTDSGTAILSAISKVGSDTTEHGSFAITDTDTQEVPANTYAFCSWTTASDMTISDLNGMELGWKASE